MIPGTGNLCRSIHAVMILSYHKRCLIHIVEVDAININLSKWRIESMVSPWKLAGC